LSGVGRKHRQRCNRTRQAQLVRRLFLHERIQRDPIGHDEISIDRRGFFQTLFPRDQIAGQRGTAKSGRDPEFGA